MKVESTKDYEQFSVIKGNRRLDNAHLNHLGNSIAEKNMLEYFPIIVNEKMEVIDGQHRLEVAKRQELDIYYVVVGGTGLEDVQQLNSNLRSWLINDYMFSYIERGFKDYEILNNFSKKYNLPTTTAVNLLSNGPVLANERDLMGTFKRGEFKVSDLDAAVAFADELRRLSPYVEGTAWRSREFLVALGVVNSNISLTEFVNKVISTGATIRRETRKNDYLLAMENLWNVGRSKSEKISFF